jgi:hypothetical protein
MDTIPQISDSAKTRPSADDAPDSCWCGQDMQHVRGRHCPRCGTARATRVAAVLPRLAA